MYKDQSCVILSPHRVNIILSEVEDRGVHPAELQDLGPLFIDIDMCVEFLQMNDVRDRDLLPGLGVDPQRDLAPLVTQPEGELLNVLRLVLDRVNWDVVVLGDYPELHAGT